MSEQRKIVTGLLIIAILEIALYSRSFSMFFCGDSLYYLSRRLTSLSDVINIFSKVDHLQEYRPLPFILFSFVYYPLFKLDPFGYHFVPLIFHILNTLLVFLLAKKLLNTNLGAFVATFYFGTHSVNFFITYDMTMLTDFTYAFFYLLASLAFLKYLDTERKVWLAGCVLAFALSLLTKEAAITLLATVIFSAILYKPGEQTSVFRTSLRMIREAWPLFAVAAIYLVVLLAIKDWSLYPRQAGHPHYATLAVKSLAMKFKYLQWAFNMPDGLVWKRFALPKLIAAAALAPFVAMFLFFVVRGMSLKSRAVWCAVLWFVATLSPVLPMANLTMLHYLYVPIVGIALVFGSLAKAAHAYLRPIRLGALAATGMVLSFCAVLINACWTNITSYMADSWLSNGSVVAQNCLQDLKYARPNLPADATLYFLKSVEKDLPWFFDYGKMFNIFFNKPSIESLFADRAAKLPRDYLNNDNVFILRFVRPHLYDVTEEYKADMRDTTSIKLMQLVGEQNVDFDRRGAYYPRYDVFDTPTGKPTFVMALARAEIAREALVTIAGARVRFDVPPIERQNRLTFSLTMAFDVGDGAEGRIYFEHDRERDLLYSRRLNPAQNEAYRRWLSEAIDLSRYAGKKGFLVFECNPGPRGDTVADWLAWSHMKIMRSPGDLVDDTPLDQPKPAWLQMSPTTIRLGEFVIVTVGNGSHMTIDVKYRLDGAARIQEKWFTANAAGQFAFQPREAGKWEIVAIKNSLGKEWVSTPASLTVK